METNDLPVDGLDNPIADWADAFMKKQRDQQTGDPFQDTCTALGNRINEHILSLIGEQEADENDRVVDLYANAQDLLYQAKQFLQRAHEEENPSL